MPGFKLCGCIQSQEKQGEPAEEEKVNGGKDVEANHIEHVSIHMWAASCKKVSKGPSHCYTICMGHAGVKMEVMHVGRR